MVIMIASLRAIARKRVFEPTDSVQNIGDADRRGSAFFAQSQQIARLTFITSTLGTTSQHESVLEESEGNKMRKGRSIRALAASLLLTFILIASMIALAAPAAAAACSTNKPDDKSISTTATAGTRPHIRNFRSPNALELKALSF